MIDRPARCKYCGSTRLLSTESDETFYGRIGCDSCNRWQNEPELRWRQSAPNDPEKP